MTRHGHAFKGFLDALDKECGWTMLALQEKWCVEEENPRGVHANIQAERSQPHLMIIVKPTSSGRAVASCLNIYLASGLDNLYSLGKG